MGGDGGGWDGPCGRDLAGSNVPLYEMLPLEETGKKSPERLDKSASSTQFIMYVHRDWAVRQVRGAVLEGLTTGHTLRRHTGPQPEAKPPAGQHPPSHLVRQARRGVLTFWNCLKGTNCTMSLLATSPDGERRAPLSLSRNSMALKSAPPTPTMMMDMGSLAALTMACRVSSRSVITPSVMIRSTKYCCQRESTAREQLSSRDTGSADTCSLRTPCYKSLASVMIRNSHGNAACSLKVAGHRTGRPMSREQDVEMPQDKCPASAGVNTSFN